MLKKNFYLLAYSVVVGGGGGGREASLQFGATRHGIIKEKLLSKDRSHETEV